jgi:hypothetical protein
MHKRLLHNLSSEESRLYDLNENESTQIIGNTITVKQQAKHL